MKTGQLKAINKSAVMESFTIQTEAEALNSANWQPSDEKWNVQKMHDANSTKPLEYNNLNKSN